MFTSYFKPRSPNLLISGIHPINRNKGNEQLKFGKIGKTICYITIYRVFDIPSTEVA